MPTKRIAMVLEKSTTKLDSELQIENEAPAPAPALSDLKPTPKDPMAPEASAAGSDSDPTLDYAGVAGEPGADKAEEVDAEADLIATAAAAAAAVAEVEAEGFHYSIVLTRKPACIHRPDVEGTGEAEAECSHSRTSSTRQPIILHPPVLEETAESTKALPPCRVLKRRWYVLAVYCLYALTQVCVWNTFGPIYGASHQVLGWTPTTISTLSSLGPIAYVLSGLFFSWLLNTRGLRQACLLSAVLVAVGTVLRCFTMVNPAATGLIVAGHFLNGLGGPMANSGAPKLSACWFPMEERATATTLGTMALYLGLALSFLIGPNVVPVVKEAFVPNSSLVSFDDRTWPSANDGVDKGSFKLNAKAREEKSLTEVRTALLSLMYAEAIWSVTVCLVMVIYFPSEPPVPVSLSSAVHREHFVQGLRDLFLRHRAVLVMGLVSALSVGLLNCWTSLLHVNLSGQGVSEKTAGQIGFLATLSAMAFSLSMSRIVDKFFRMMKYMVMVLFTIGVVSFLVFSLSFVDVITPSEELFYITVVVGKTSVEACYPALFELACEMAFPVGEGMTTILLTYTNNILSLVFLSIFSLPGIGTRWMNWTVTVALTFTLPVLAAVRQQFGRRDLDQQRSHSYGKTSP